MQYLTNEEKQLQLLQSIEKRLAKAYPKFEELSRDEQRAVFFRAVERASWAEIFELEQSHPDLIARREQLKRAKEQERLAMVKRAGQNEFDDAVERISEQLPTRLS